MLPTRLESAAHPDHRRRHLRLLLWVGIIRFFPGLLPSSIILPWLLSALLVGGAIYIFGASAGLPEVIFITVN